MSLEERIRQSVGSAVDEMRTRMEAEVRALVQELVSSAAEERQAAVATARDEALADARRELERQVAEAEARVTADVGQRLAEARAHEREQTTHELRERVQADADARLQAAAAEAEARLASTIAESDARLTTAVAEADDRLRAAQAEAARMLDASVAEARAREREAALAGLSRLREAIRGLDGATTLSEVLDVLGQSAGREAARAALLLLRGDRLQGWKLSGFGARDASPKNVELGLVDGGIIGLAVTTTRTVTTQDGHAANAGPDVFELPADRMGLAVPVIVGGRAVAVVYADSAASDPQDGAVPSCWTEAIEILARHAARCLEALTAQRAAATPAPRFWVPPGTGPGLSSLPHKDDTPLAGVPG
jgi:hypothetical protein